MRRARLAGAVDRGHGSPHPRSPESGFVLVMTALLLIPLLTFTAFAVDLGAWYAQKAKMQSAADAGALAGTVWAADNNGKWQSTAISTVAANGFTNAGTTQVTVTRISGTKVQVDIDAPGRQYFSGFIVRDPRLRVVAVADYQRPLHMGSPENRMGTDPDLGYQPYYWLNVGSDTTAKGNGDRFTSLTCAAGAWGCTSAKNTEYSATGTTFHVSTSPIHGSGNLDIQVYDPAYTYSGDLCESVFINAADMPAVQAMAASRYGEGAAVAAQRYGHTPYCPGDQSLGNGVAPNTTYIVRAPDTTPLNDLDNPPICSITFDGRKPASNTALRNLLAGPGSAVASGRERAVFSDHYHRWSTICSIPSDEFAPNGGDFIVQVKTTANLSNAPTPTTAATASLSIGTLDLNTTPGTGGYNRFSLRAGYGVAGTFGWPTGINVYGPTRLPIYVNGVDVANGTPKANVASTVFNSSFYATRVTPDNAGNILQLSFWDIGDVTGSPGAVDFTLQSPDLDVTSRLLTATGCTFKRDGVTISGANTYGASVSGCRITNLTSGSGDPSSTGFNGRLVTVNISIPGDYTCAVADPVSGCWLVVAATYRGVPSDTTTWSAAIVGDPAHLVE